MPSTANALGAFRPLASAVSETIQRKVQVTVACERFNSVKRAREFLYSLLDPKKTPRVPKEIRLQARSVLKHFPSDFDMEMTRKALPNRWEGFG